MSRENLPEDTFSKDRAELFEALGHPTRIKILELIANSQMGFSDLKKSLNIESSGQLQFHLSKLQGLIKTVEGNYALTDEGKEALRIMAVKETVKTEPKIKRIVTPLQAISIALVICLALTVTFSLYSYNQSNLNYQKLSGLTNSLLTTSTNSSYSVPISEADAIIIALNYGGWNASSLNGMTVSATLTWVGNANEPYPIWQVIVEPIRPHSIPPWAGFYWVDAKTGAIIPAPPAA